MDTGPQGMPFQEASRMDFAAKADRESQRQDRKDGAANRSRRALLVAGFAACVAQGVPACPQLRLCASQLQALDRLAAMLLKFAPGQQGIPSV